MKSIIYPYVHMVHFKYTGIQYKHYTCMLQSSLKTSPKDRVISLTGGPASSMSTVTLDKLISDEQSIKAVLGIISNDNNEEDEEQVKKGRFDD